MPVEVWPWRCCRAVRRCPPRTRPFMTFNGVWSGQICLSSKSTYLCSHIRTTSFGTTCRRSAAISNNGWPADRTARSLTAFLPPMAPGLGPYVVTDTRNGPIVLERQATVGPYCYISGPAAPGRAPRDRARGDQGWRELGPYDQDWGRDRGIGHRTLYKQATSRFLGTQLPGQLGQPGGRHLQQRPEKHLRPGQHGVLGGAAWPPACSSSARSWATTPRRRSIPASSPAKP